VTLTRDGTPAKRLGGVRGVAHQLDRALREAGDHQIQQLARERLL
jgi:hypothetical protein